MRVLLDECVHAGLRRAIADHAVSTVQSLGWRGIKNGSLLKKAAAESFDVFITTDKKLEYQQYSGDLPLPVITINTRGTMMSDLEPAIPLLLDLLKTELSSQFYRVGK